MTVTIIDIENSITRKEFTSPTSGKVHKYTDNSPYETSNKLVSVGYRSSSGESDYLLFHHKELTAEQIARVPANRARLQSVLDKTDVLVGHNIKYDLQWLLECGFTYEGRVFDTMLFEYIISKGMPMGLDLASCCARWKIPCDDKDMLYEHLNKGGNVDDMPLADLIKYGKSDIDITVKLYNVHKNLLSTNPTIQKMLPTIKARNEFLRVLVDMERNGFKIDQAALKDIEDTYRARLAEIQPRIRELVVEAVGHTPINLDSPEQLSELVFGFKIHNKKEWAKFFNIGSETEGQRKGKAKYKNRRTPEQIARKLDECSVQTYKTKAEHCKDCQGRGYYFKVKKDGNNYKRSTTCVGCSGSGFSYVSTGQPAGLGLAPLPYDWASSGGFSISKKSISWILANVQDIPPLAKEFLGLMNEYNAITVYLSNFVEGIARKIGSGDMLHMSYNQCVTRTGRLSSTFHNFPRGKTFPIKKSIVSRWEGGTILNADFRGLEFRVASLLSGDETSRRDIIANVDAHNQTADFMTGRGQTTDRQAAKNHTFKPLFGGVTGTEVERAYYKWFLDKYSGIRDWQTRLGQEALETKQLVSPSGMHYAFPYTYPMPNGSVSGFTAICNYCIQGFSFELVMIAIIELSKALKARGFISKLIINVHDSAVVDVHPTEKEKVIDLVKEVFGDMPKHIKNYFPAANDNVPIEFEMGIGDDWYNQKEIAV